MSFRFSLKWMLAAMVYAAVAAAAFTQRVWFYADALWVVTVAAFGYALLVVIYTRGERQARAAGFAVLASCFLACLYLAPNSMPTRHLVNALPTPADELAQAQYAYAYAYPQPVVSPPLPANTSPTPIAPAYAPMPAAPPTTVPAFLAAPVTMAYSGAPAYLFRFSAANAVATLGAGLIGCLLGAAAYRQAQPRDHEG